MAVDALTINATLSLQVSSNDSLSDVFEVNDRDVAGTVKFETTTTVGSGVANQLLVLPSSVAGSGRYLMMKSDVPVKFGINDTANPVPSTFLLLKLESPYLSLFYLTNTGGTTAYVRVLVVG